jgi:hypothetical protein
MRLTCRESIGSLRDACRPGDRGMDRRPLGESRVSQGSATERYRYHALTLPRGAAARVAGKPVSGKPTKTGRNRRDGRQRLYGCGALRSGEFYPYAPISQLCP